MSLFVKSLSLSVGFNGLLNLSSYQFSVQLTLEREKEKEELLKAEEEKNKELLAEEERKKEQLAKEDMVRIESLKDEEQKREALERQEQQRLAILAEEEARIDALLKLEEQKNESIRIEEELKNELIAKEQEAFALLKERLNEKVLEFREVIFVTQPGLFTKEYAHSNTPNHPQKNEELTLAYNPPGSNQYGKPSSWRVEQVEDLRRKYEEFERGKREQDLFNRFDSYHDRQQTEKEERERLREELEKRLEEQRRIELEREKNRREHFRELYSERDK